ncbi:hypothetical protein ACFQXA_06155 [Nocardiopsis composta]
MTGLWGRSLQGRTARRPVASGAGPRPARRPGHGGRAAGPACHRPARVGRGGGRRLRPALAEEAIAELRAAAGGCSPRSSTSAPPPSRGRRPNPSST